MGGFVIAALRIQRARSHRGDKRKVEELSRPAEGVRLVPFYDRTQLINRSSGPLREASLQTGPFTRSPYLPLAFRSFSRDHPLPLLVLVSFSS